MDKLSEIILGKGMTGFRLEIERLNRQLSSFFKNARYVPVWLLALSLVACNSTDGNGGDGIETFNVTPSAGEHIGISPASALAIQPGYITSFTLFPEAGYEIDSVSGCNGTLSGNTYTTGVITADCTVTVSSVELLPPDAPLLSLTPTAVKNFSFSWADVSQETGYRLLENPDDLSGYAQVATIDADATDHDHQVFLPGRINASYILQACNSIGCSDSAPVFVGGALEEAVGYVKASNTGARDGFGISVSLARDGNTLAVGAKEEDSNATVINGAQGDNSASGFNSGAVYIFTRSGDGWSQQAYIKASNGDANDHFGSSLTLSGGGNILAVGASGEDSSATGIDGDQSDNSLGNSGAVYVYTRNGTNWAQQAYIKASNTDAGDQFGNSISLSSDGLTLAVGSNDEQSNAIGLNGDQSNNAAEGSGAVYVFTLNGAAWSQQSYIKASNTESFDQFGYNLSLSGDGNTLAVGARGENSNATGIGGDESDNSASSSGAVYVFIRSGASWAQQAYVKASNTGVYDRFGFNLGLSDDGDTLAVGADNEKSNATGIDGDESNDAAAGSGAVYIFTRNVANWSQQAYIKASNSEQYDVFGYSLALSGSGNTLAVGAVYESSDATGFDGDQNDNSANNSGAVYVFTRSSDNWSQKAYLKASNTGAEDRHGASISLSSDGDTLAVGSYYERSSAIGINGDQSDNTAYRSGAVYLY